MLLFARAEADALKRFLVDDGIGKEAPGSGSWLRRSRPFIRRGTDEKRWIDGVLARKKGLGL